MLPCGMLAFASRHQKFVLIVISACAGLVTGMFTAPHPVHACSCLSHEWPYRLESVMAPEDARDPS